MVDSGTHTHTEKKEKQKLMNCDKKNKISPLFQKNMGFAHQRTNRLSEEKKCSRNHFYNYFSISHSPYIKKQKEHCKKELWDIVISSNLIFNCIIFGVCDEYLGGRRIMLKN